MLRPRKQCRIKMLPDVGMVKVYPKCVLKAANVDRVVTLTRNTPPCSWPFSTSWFFHPATSGIRDTVHHPYISTCFVGNIFTPLLFSGFKEMYRNSQCLKTGLHTLYPAYERRPCGNVCVLPNYSTQYPHVYILQFPHPSPRMWYLVEELCYWLE